MQKTIFLLIVSGMIGLVCGLNYNNNYLRTIYTEQTENLIDETVNEIVLACYDQPKNETQVECVQNKLNNIQYKEHSDGFRSPTETLKKGGLCRDVVVMQAAIFKKLGWEYDFTFPLKKHVFITIATNIHCEDEEHKNCGLYCNLDWGSYACYRIKG